MICETSPAPARFAGSLGNNTDQMATVVADANKNSNTNKTHFSIMVLFESMHVRRLAEIRNRAGPKKIIASYDLVRAIAAAIMSTESKFVSLSLNNTEETIGSKCVG